MHIGGVSGGRRGGLLDIRYGPNSCLEEPNGGLDNLAGQRTGREEGQEGMDGEGAQGGGGPISVARKLDDHSSVYNFADVK